MMRIYEKLLSRHLPVGVYGGDPDALCDELKAYAAELELLYGELKRIFRERFITTAEDEGLRAYEVLFGPDRTGESVESRREMLLLRMNLGNGDFTLAGLKKALDSLGLRYVISEFPQIGKLNVTATTDYTPAQQAWIRREVSKLIPASVEFQLTFNTLTWAQWDALDRTFSVIDSEDSTWQDIDERTDTQ